MLAKNLTFLSKADAAGIVLGARVPIILTSRADSRAHAAWPPAPSPRSTPTRAARIRPLRRVTPMDTILVVNAGSSSVKFQIFAVDGDGSLRAAVKGQIDGIGSRPRLRATAADGDRAGRPQLSTTEAVPMSRPGARDGGRLAARRARRSIRSRSVIASCMAARTTTGRS